MVDYNQEIQRGFHQKKEKQGAPDGFYHLLVVTGNLSISQALGTTLEHFLLNGRKINVIQVSSFEDARDVVEQNSDTILVLVDDLVHLNGAYTSFFEYVRGKLRNHKCIITLKEDLIRAKNPVQNSIQHEDYSREFIVARERLIEITRMILMTLEMEKKIGYSPDEEILENIETEFRRLENHKETGITKEQLYSIMAHDLKGPVGSIKVILDFLTNEPDLLDQETSKDLLIRVRESANNVHELLEDFLFWTRMIKENGYFNPGKTDLERAIRENTVLVRSLAAAKEIVMVVDMPRSAWVLADEYMLNTVLRNLLYNAIKFTGSGGQVKITVSIYDQDYKVTITDNGVGIPPERLKKIVHNLETFSTAGTAQELGTGLGLVLCRDFIEKNGGSFFAESTVGVGSSFGFTLPVCKDL
jgi:signal transduction histidine kinase